MNFESDASGDIPDISPNGDRETGDVTNINEVTRGEAAPTRYTAGFERSKTQGLS